MAGKIVADQIQGTTTTETTGAGSVTIPNTINTKFVVNGSAKAWGVFDSTGSGSAVVRDSINVSSMTENDTADDTFTLINAFSSTNISIAGSAAEKTSTSQTAARFLCRDADTLGSASAPRVFCRTTSNSAGDFQDGSSFVMHGDLA